MQREIKLSKEDMDSLIEKITKHFQEAHDEDIGELKATLLYDFLIKECGGLFYNQGIEDARTYLLHKLDDVYALQQ